MGGIPGSPAMSSCSEGEPPQSPIESYLSPSSRSRSPIISSSMPPHSVPTQNDVDSLRLLLQEVLFFEFWKMLLYKIFRAIHRLYIIDFQLLCSIFFINDFIYRICFIVFMIIYKSYAYNEKNVTYGLIVCSML